MSMATTLFGLGAVIAILCGYFAPKYMPLPKPKIVGIDLGTTSSCIGVYQPGSGEVLILKDDNGNACIPSVVAFVDNKIHVGHDAMRMASYNPRETVYDAKRFIGKTMTPAFLAEESQRYPFAMKHDVNGSIVFVIPGYESERDLTPEYIGSLILGKTLCYIYNLKTNLNVTHLYVVSGHYAVLDYAVYQCAVLKIRFLITRYTHPRYYKCIFTNSRYFYNIKYVYNLSIIFMQIYTIL